MTSTHYQAEIDCYNECLQCYYNQMFEKAIDKIQAFLKIYNNNQPATYLLKRCKAYLENPPPKDWNGVFVATGK